MSVIKADQAANVLNIEMFYTDDPNQWENNARTIAQEAAHLRPGWIAAVRQREGWLVKPEDLPKLAAAQRQLFALGARKLIVLSSAVYAMQANRTARESGVDGPIERYQDEAQWRAAVERESAGRAAA